jgi:hypothetical protein
MSEQAVNLCDRPFYLPTKRLMHLAKLVQLAIFAPYRLGRRGRRFEPLDSLLDPLHRLDCSF